MPPVAKSRRVLRPQLRWGFLAAAVLFTIWCTLRSMVHTGAGSAPAQVTKRYLHTGADGGSGFDDSASAAGVRRMGAGSFGQTVATAPPCPEPKVVEKLVEKVVEKTKEVIKRPQESQRLYHVVTTAQGFANHWQARIHYYWYKKQREACRQMDAPCDMGGFTRLLHSGEADDLMDEVPTVVVDPLPPSASNGSSYVVLNRPFAFMTWLKKVSIPERYILMGEGDHLFLRPMPNLMNGESQGAALFTYIVPGNYPNIVRKFIGNVSEEEVRRVPQIGNSPTFVSIEEFRVLAPLWYNTTMEIFNDEEAHNAWNWVLEMYGYTLATYRAGQHRNLKQYSNMLAHPPFDRTMKDYKGEDFYILHLTYPCRYNSSGGFTEDEKAVVWQFDKRLYMSKPPPRNLEPPPANIGNDLVRVIVRMVNDATANIPCWDDYVKTSKVVRNCTEAQKLEHHTV